MPNDINYLRPKAEWGKNGATSNEFDKNCFTQLPTAKITCALKIAVHGTAVNPLSLVACSHVSVYQFLLAIKIPRQAGHPLQPRYYDEAGMW